MCSFPLYSSWRLLLGTDFRFFFGPPVQFFRLALSSHQGSWWLRWRAPRSKTDHICGSDQAELHQRSGFTAEKLEMIPLTATERTSRANGALFVWAMTHSYKRAFRQVRNGIPSGTTDPPSRMCVVHTSDRPLIGLCPLCRRGCRRRRLDCRSQRLSLQAWCSSQQRRELRRLARNL